MTVYGATIFAPRIVFQACDPLPIRIGFGSGWPLGHPSVTQGPRKRSARVCQGSIGGSTFLCNKTVKKGLGRRDCQKSPKPIRGFTAKDAKVVKKDGKKISTVTDKAGHRELLLPSCIPEQLLQPLWRDAEPVGKSQRIYKERRAEHAVLNVAPSGDGKRRL